METDNKTSHLERLGALLEKYTDLTKVEIIQAYTEQGRVYHGLSHIWHMLDKNLDMSDELFLAVWFHDIIYSTKSTVNEKNSAEFLLKHWNGDKKISEDISNAILSTEDFEPINNLGKELIDLDLFILKEPLEKLIEYEKKIFLEFECFDYSDYKDGRLEVLESFNTEEFPNIKYLIDYVKTKEAKIGVFAGSFNPFHVGHMNILQKAEKVFDKVIVAYGVNVEKITKEGPGVLAERTKILDSLKTRQVDFYDGLLTDYLKTKNYDVTLIRGLRNFTDFAYENNMTQFLKELMPDIKIAYFICDKEYEHISSSAIKGLPEEVKKKWLIN